MAKDKIIFQSNEEVSGKFKRTGEYIDYTGILTVYSRKTKPVQLELKCVYNNFILEDIMDENITFSGNSITEVYAKLSKWYLRYDIVFQN